MHILVINSGSSSLKFKLFNMKDQDMLFEGIIEKIGLEKTHAQALHEVFTLLRSKDYDLNSLSAIGHRVVHGGEEITAPVVVDEAVIEIIRKYSELAPLHNPANLAGILACQKQAPGILQVAVFDTAFHQGMSADHYLYPIPYEYYQKYKIRKYGFHGTSHEYVYNRLLTHFDVPLSAKVITCHLGNGASITAITDGRVVETSMGFTPLEGLMMGTRSGNIDPGVITYLMKKEKLDPQQMEDILNTKSGLLGISGVSNDMRDIIEGYKKGEERCILALDMYLNAIVKYIGAYRALLGGCDHLVLTAGIGERSDFFRNLLQKRLAGVPIGKVHVIPTDEEILIAQKTMNILDRPKNQ